MNRFEETAMSDIHRFSSRRQRLDHAFLSERVKDAKSYHITYLGSDQANDLESPRKFKKLAPKYSLEPHFRPRNGPF